jgi:hypothetical protein
MAFTDFKSADEVQKAYNIKYIEEDFLIAASKYLVRIKERNNCENYYSNKDKTSNKINVGLLLEFRLL